jgi:hypothetical protein
VQHRAIQLILGLLAILNRHKFNEQLGDLVALKDQHFADASMHAEFIVDQVVGELEYHGIIDADEQYT